MSSDFNRRDFLVRGTQAAAALSLSSPALRRILDASAWAESNGMVRSAPAIDVGAIAGGIKWRMIGPFRGGRVAAATGVPSRPNEFYFGAVNGGVWKSIDAGRVWTPVFDSQPVASIGAIAVAPSAPDTVYVGSGESSLRDSVGFGNGMYKSTDAGRTWSHLGLDDTHHIGKIAIDPHNRLHSGGGLLCMGTRFQRVPMFVQTPPPWRPALASVLDGAWNYASTGGR